MKKRMNLTEKELAIGMWLYVKSRIHTFKNIAIHHSDIMSLKYDYIQEHDTIADWPSYCILCKRHNKVCPECPLGSCGLEDKTLWAVVTNCVYDANAKAYVSPFTLEERLEACDKIIEAIEKDIPDDFKS